MRKDIAKKIVDEAVATLRQIDQIAGPVRQSEATPAEEKVLLRGIGDALMTLVDQVTDPVLIEFPDLIPHPDLTPRALRGKSSPRHYFGDRDDGHDA